MSVPLRPSPQFSTAEKLALNGDDEHRLADCTGRDVAIQGLRSAYVLRGGCHSVTVTGDLDTVQAEISPGARIVIDGVGTMVAWALAGPGDGPVERVHGNGSRVRRTDRIGGQPVR